MVKYVIKEAGTERYWDSNTNTLGEYERAVKYDKEEEAYGKVYTKCPIGTYQILPIIVKE